MNEDKHDRFIEEFRTLVKKYYPNYKDTEVHVNSPKSDWESK